MTVSLANGGGEGLGTMWGENLARNKLREAGFSNVEVKRVPGDIVNSYFIAKKSQVNLSGKIKPSQPGILGHGYRLPWLG